MEGKTLVVKRIHVTYHLVVDEDADRAVIERGHAFHAERCPVYRSIHPQITVTTALRLVPAGGAAA